MSTHRRLSAVVAVFVMFIGGHAFALGESGTNPAGSCKNIKIQNPSAADGVYWIDPDGGSTSNAFQAVCDMTTDGGGWTLGLNSVQGSEAPGTDIISTAGMPSLTVGHTRNLAPLAIDQNAEIRHYIYRTTDLVTFHGKYIGNYHDRFGAAGDWTFLSGHTPNAEYTLRVDYHYGAYWSTPANDRDAYPGNCAAGYGISWYYVACYTVRPVYSGLGPTIYGGAGTYRIWVRELTTVDLDSDDDGYNDTLVPPNSAPVIADQTFNVAENSAGAVATVIASDPDADSLTYSITGGDASAFTVAPSTGILTPTGTLDYETKNSYALTVQVSDGSLTSSATITINIDDLNESPKVNTPLADQGATEDISFSFAFPASTFVDVDAGDTLTYTTSALPAWLGFDAATRTFSGTPANGDVGAFGVTVTATDTGGAFTSDTFTITVTNVNDSPVLSTPLSDQNATEDTPFSFTFDAATFADPDAGDTLTYTTSTLPAWLSFDGATRTFSGTPANGDVGSFDVTVSARDGGGLFTSDTFTITVANTNDAPTLDNAIADQGATEDATFSFAFAANTFADVDAGDTLTYTTSALPSWLGFDAATRTFSGTPTNGDVGSFGVTVTATDTSSATASDTFTITVANVNDAPTLDNAIADQNATEDAAFNFAFAANAFGDVDAGDTLTYTTSALPAWLGFNAATRTFSGTPVNADVGSFDVTVTATDTSSATASDIFRITVINTNDAPVATDDGYAIDEDNTLNVAVASGVRMNDTDDDGDVLTIAVATGVSHGSLSLASDGSFTYTPNTDYNGPDGFTYTASDGNGGSDTGAVTITVNAVSDVPVLSTLSPNAICEGSSATTITVTGTLFRNTSVVKWNNAPRTTTFVDASHVSFDASMADVATGGTAAVTVTSVDGDSAALNFTIAEDADPPIVTPPAATELVQTACVAGAQGLTLATSPDLASWLAAATGDDVCTSSATALAPQVAGIDVASDTLFPAGTTAVTFRYRDNAGNIGSATANVTVRIYGDLNEDDAVDARDLVILANYIVRNLTPLTAPYSAPLLMGDLNGDGNVDALDLVIMAHHIVGNIECVPLTTP